MPARRRQLWITSGVLVLALSVWFSTAAVVPSLAPAWNISSGEASWLTTAVQIGFVFGALISAALNLPDRLAIHRLIALGAFAAALTNCLVALLAHGLDLALPLRFATGMSLALVYPLGVKLMASWFDAERALAVGIVVGALTLGSGAPQLVNALGSLDWRGVLIATSALAAIGGLCATFLREGPLLRSGGGGFRPGYAVEMFTDRRQRLINLGYFGHMWELYALWTWLPTYLAASLVAGHSDSGRLTVGLISFSAIGLAGFAGCVVGGEGARRVGSVPVARLSLLLSGCCCVASALVFGAPPWLLVIVLIAWGFGVIADSAQFSTVLSQVADQRFVGTALTVQMAIGYLVTVITIRTMPFVVDAIGWRWALSTLALGPLVGLLALRGLTSRPDPDDGTLVLDGTAACFQDPTVAAEVGRQD